jgi:hypothetical protein
MEILIQLLIGVAGTFAAVAVWLIVVAVIDAVRNLAKDEQ